MPKNYCIMQIWAESGKSALPICNYSQILYQFLTFTQNLKRSQLMRLNSSFLLLSRCLFNSKNKPVCQEHPENLNVHLLLIIRLIFNSTTITFFNIVWDTPSITVTAILYFTSISIFSGGLAKSLSISFSSTPAIFAIVSLDMP